MVNLKNEQNRSANELQIAQQRVAELEAQLAHSSVSVNDNEDNQQSGSTFPHPPAEIERYYSGFAQTILGIDQAQTDLEAAAQSTAQTQPLPSSEILQLATRTFFDAYHLQYPFLDRNGFMLDVQDIWTEEASGTAPAGKRTEFVVLMIASVGAYVSGARGGMDQGIAPSLRERALRCLGAATSKTDLVCSYEPSFGRS